MNDILQSTGDYRIFVGAFPTGELPERIQSLRQRHDAKTARITASHVTLAGTWWRTGPATPENEAETIARLQDVQDQIRPFELTLGGVQSFLPGTPVIYLHVEPTDGLLDARRALLQALGQDKHRRFVPHLTLTMRLGRAETKSLLAQLQQSEWHTEQWSVCRVRQRITEHGAEDVDAPARWLEWFARDRAGQRERDLALPVEPETRGQSKLFKT